MFNLDWCWDTHFKHPTNRNLINCSVLTHPTSQKNHEEPVKHDHFRSYPKSAPLSLVQTSGPPDRKQPVVPAAIHPVWTHQKTTPNRVVRRLQQELCPQTRLPPRPSAATSLDCKKERRRRKLWWNVPFTKVGFSLIINYRVYVNGEHSGAQDCFACCRLCCFATPL